MRGSEVRGIGDIVVSLTEASLPIPLRFLQPSLQYGEVLRLHIDEAHPDARGDFHPHKRTHGKRIHHVQITTAQAQLTHAYSDLHIGSLFHQLRVRDKRIPGYLTSFWSHYLVLCSRRVPSMIAKFRLASLTGCCYRRRPGK